VLLNLILGGDVHSRLYREVREELGLCYHVISYLDALSGLLYVEAGIEGGEYGQARGRIESVVQSLAVSGPREGELDRARRLAHSRLASMEDDRDALVRFAYSRMVVGSDESRAHLRERLRVATASQVATAAGRLELDTVFYLRPTDDPV
jgi:predicted Zn-dependent peptidase